MSDGVRIAVGVSGQGSNLRALFAAQQRGLLGGSITTVFADRVCPGMEWAIEQGIPILYVPPSGHPDRESWDMGLAAGLQQAGGGRRRPGRVPAHPGAPTPWARSGAASSTSTRRCCRRSRACTPSTMRSRPGSR